MTDELANAITLLKANGYRVTPIRTKAKPQLGLNAIGKPYSPLYDPNYRVKHKTSTAHLFKPYGEMLRNSLTS